MKAKNNFIFVKDETTDSASNANISAILNHLKSGDGGEEAPTTPPAPSSSTQVNKSTQVEEKRKKVSAFLMQYNFLEK